MHQPVFFQGKILAEKAHRTEQNRKKIINQTSNQMYAKADFD